MFISSNDNLRKLKKKYNRKKAGFSGILDPFANGTLVVAFGQYTKLFKFLHKPTKVYSATLWLGAESETLDIEKVKNIRVLKPFKIDQIDQVLDSLLGEIEYLAPRYSAKNINGERAYRLARQGKEFELPSLKSTIYSIKLKNYSHPFLSFEIEVSEGSYIRSIASIIAEELGTVGSLSFLQRKREGKFIFEDEKPLDPLLFLEDDFRENIFLDEYIYFVDGKTLSPNQFTEREDGRYFVKFGDEFALLEIIGDEVKYLLNKIPLFKAGKRFNG
jgi:tRNA pseudouridine55 synthase